MRNDVLCIYYSRTGKTRRAVLEIAEVLGCEAVEVRDNVKREGALGWLFCGFDAMRKGTRRLRKFNTAQPLGKYKLVILATPVWAGRCSSIIRGLIKRRGYEMQNVAYLITHASDNLYPAVFEQMDKYSLAPHVAAVSLRIDSVGYHFWRDQFIKSVEDFLAHAEDVPQVEEPTEEEDEFKELERLFRQRGEEEDA